MSEVNKFSKNTENPQGLLEIDGSIGEGGGQIIRTSLTLAAITQTHIKITNIRAKRNRPGLAAQHLMCAKAVRNICRGTLRGAEIGSTELIFHPGEIVGGKYDFDIGTAGSVSLVAQTIIPILLKISKPSTIRIIGGTHVPFSPTSDYLEKVFCPAISLFGAKISIKHLKSGYYPAGGGEIEIQVENSELAGVTNFPNSSSLPIEVLIRLANLETSIAIREKKIFIQNKIEKVYLRQEESLSPGNAILAWSAFRGAAFLGEKGKRAEAVAQETLDFLKAELESDVDLHLADQILLYAVLSNGQSEFKTSRITEHLRTNANIIQKFIDRKIEIDEENKKVKILG